MGAISYFCIVKTFKEIDLSFTIETDLLSLRMEATEADVFTLRREPGKVVIRCPEAKMTLDAARQEWLRKVVREALREQARLLLPPRLRLWAERSGLSYSRCFIKSTRSRWGSYSARGNLNLSCYLLLMDGRYVDYTICHELCHSREMNHGPRFWALLDGLTDGHARQLNREMRQTVRRWYDEGDARAGLLCL